MRGGDVDVWSQRFKFRNNASTYCITKHYKTLRCITGAGNLQVQKRV